MAADGSVTSERPNPATPSQLRRLCSLSAKLHSRSPEHKGSSLSLPTTAFFLVSCLLSSLAPGASAVSDAALGAASTASQLTAQHVTSSSEAFSSADDGSNSGSDDVEYDGAPVHVFRDPATGKLVEKVEPERREDEQQLNSAAALAAELDALYMEESVPVRGRGNRAAKLGRKSSLGGSSSKGDAGRNVNDRTTASSDSDPTAAAVSASSLGSSGATRGSRRGARRLSFGL